MADCHNPTVHLDSSCNGGRSHELQKLVSVCETEIRAIYFSHRFMSNNVKNRETREVYLCFICLKERYSGKWLCNNNIVGRYRQKTNFHDDLPGLYICTSSSGICKHIQREHQHVLKYSSKSCRNIQNYDECFVEIYKYLDVQAWRNAANLYYGKHPPKPVNVISQQQSDECTGKATAVIDLTPELSPPSGITSTEAKTRSTDETYPYNIIPWNSTAPEAATSASTTRAVPLMLDEIDGASGPKQLLWRPRRDHKAVPFVTGSMNGRFWKRLYYSLSYDEASRIYAVEDQKRKEAQRRREPPPPTIEEIVWRDYGGDWELWSDQITWKEDYEELSVVSSELPPPQISGKKRKIATVSPTNTPSYSREAAVEEPTVASDFLCCSLSPLVHQ